MNMLYTIGAGKKSAREFFTLLQQNSVKRLIDIRLNNTSQLAGYTKKGDLEYFLKAIANIEYMHIPEFAPTAELMDNYKAKKITWLEYEREYTRILEQRKPFNYLDVALFAQACLLCSEPKATQCHRRLLAEYLAKMAPGLKIVHL